MSVKTISIRTDSNGDFVYDKPFNGRIYGVRLEKGDLSTPDLDITDSVHSLTFLSVDGISDADSVWHLGQGLVGSAGTAIDALSTGDTVGVYSEPIIMGNLTVTVSGGGDAKHGTLRVMFE